MQGCWNCTRVQPDECRFCVGCGNRLRPEPEMAGAVDYLISEVRRWDWMNNWRRGEVVAEYGRRRERLRCVLAGQVLLTPDTGPPASLQTTASTAEGTAPTADWLAPPRASQPILHTLGPADAAKAREEGGSAPVPQDHEAGRPVGDEPAGSASAPSRSDALPAFALDAAWPAAPSDAGHVSGDAAVSDGHAPSAQEAATFVMARITGFMEERNIRWIHTLGALLLLAAGIGFLRAQWTAIGGYVVTLVLLLAPLAAFLGASKLRASLPISSRLLSVLGGLLMPTGLLALRQFGIVEAPVDPWSCGVFLVCAAILGRLCAALDEPACLYLGATSLALSAHHLSQAAHLPALFGVVLFAVAFALVGSSVRGTLRPSLDRHARPLAQGMAVLALVSTLPGLQQQADNGSLFLFFLGAVFFAGAGYLVADVRALYASAIAAAGLAAIAVPVLQMPAVFAGVILLAVGTVYLAQGRLADETLRGPSLQLGVGLTGIGLLVVFGLDLFVWLRDGFAAQPLSHLLGSIAVALLGAVFYGCGAATYQRPSLGYGAAGCATYAWFIATSWLHHGQPQLEALALAGFPLSVMVASWLLRRLIPVHFIEPFIDVAMVVSLLAAPLALASWGVEVGPWTLALSAVFDLLFVAWRRQPAVIYLGLLWGGLSYGLAHPHDLNSIGLALLPPCAGLALVALAVEQRCGREYAIPVARSASAICIACVLLEAVLWSHGRQQGVGLTLLVAATGMAVLARLFRSWSALDRTGEDLLALGAAFVMPAGVLTACAPLDRLPLGAVALLGLFALGRILPTAWREATRLALLSWTPFLLACPLSADPRVALVEAAVPAAIWAALAVAEGSSAIGAGSCLLLLGGFAMQGNLQAEPAVRLVLLALFAMAYARLYRTDAQFAMPCWAAAAWAWGCLLDALHLDLVYGFWPFTAALGLLWLVHRPKYLDVLASITVCGLSLFALSRSPQQALPLTLGVHALGAALLALAADRRHGRDVAMPVARLCAALTAFLLAAQPALWMAGWRSSVAVCLLCAAAAIGLLEPRFRGWTAGPISSGRLLAQASALLLPMGAVAAAYALGMESSAALMGAGVACGMLGAARLLLDDETEDRHWSVSLQTAAHVGCAVIAALPLHVPGTPLLPAALWLGATLVAHVHGRLPASRVIADVAAAVVVGYAAFALPPAPALQVVWSFAAAIGVSAALRRSENDALVALLLVPGGLVLCAIHDRITLETLALGLGGLSLGFVGIGALLPLRAGANPPEEASEAFLPDIFARPLRYLSALQAVAAGVLGLCAAAPGFHPATAAVAFGAATLALHGWLHRADAGYHGAYMFMHGLLLANVPEPRMLEWYTVPLGAWLLLWSTRRPGHPALEAVGTVLMGLPSLAASVTEPSHVHAVWAGVGGLALFLLGAARGRVFLSVVGSVLVIAEALLQVHRVLVSMPWQIYATVAGCFLIGLGVLFERRRQQIIALGARLAAQWSA